MTDKPSPRWPWSTLQSDEPAQAHSVFLRGLSLGALIGAAIAGSAIWDRRHRRAGAGETPADAHHEADSKA